MFEDAQGDLYSTLVVVKFGEHVFDMSKGQKTVSLANVRSGYAAVTTFFGQLETDYGSFTLEKQIPNAVWGDTLRVNKRTGATVTISDYSQIVEVWFAAPVSLAEVVADFEALQEVAYAEEPQVYILVDSPPSSGGEPDDTEYVNGYQWSLPIIDAPRAWDLTHGIGPGGPVGIAIPDQFDCAFTGPNLHPDLVGKLVYADCASYIHCDVDGNCYRLNHGIRVAGMAGAATDNGQSVASLGWGVELYGFRFGSNGLRDLVTALGDPTHPAYGNIDVVQNSYVYGYAENAVRDLLTMGVVVVGSAGNGQGCTPDGTGTCHSQQYPAAYHFDDIDAGDGTTYEAQVSAVSGTDEWDEFVDGWTWSPGTDPLADPERAFIDVAAPGEHVRRLLTNGLPGGPYHHTVGNCWGTSCAGPIVAAQVALVLSLNPTLRVDEVYEVITRSADKVDQSEHPDSYFYTDTGTGESLSWNRYTGYGRINAYEALTYTAERFGITIPEGQTAAISADTLRMWDGSEIVADGQIVVRDAIFSARSNIWKGFRLFGEGSIFDGTEVRDAEVGLRVRAQSTNVFDTRLVANGVGLLTDYVPCVDVCIEGSSFRSSVYLDHVLVENSVLYGLYLRNTDATLTASTVRGSGRHGVVFTNATARAFSANVVESNGPKNSGYDGLRVGANGSVYAGLQGDVLGLPGQNRFADNADHQVAYLDGGYLFLGEDGVGGGQNTITEAGTGCRVFNESGDILEAENTYWGTTTAPPASYFCGSYSVDASPFLTSDPTSGSGGGYRVGNTPLLASGVGSMARRGVGGGYTVEALAAEIASVRAQVEADPGAPEAAGLVRLLGALHRLDEDDETGELAVTSTLLEALRQSLAGGGALAPDYRRTAEQALLVEVEFALVAEVYDTAEGLIAASGTLVEGEEVARTLEIDAVALDDAQGDYQAALARLDALLLDLGDGNDELAEDLAFMADEIAAKAGGEAAGRSAGATARAAAREAAPGQAATSTASALPREAALLPAYPNPAARAATVPFELPEQADVQVVVYDVLGREVAVLAEGLHEAGRHEAAFDASRLSGGVYVVRARIIPADGAARVFTQKLTLLR